jgi:antitoxin VapB
MTLTIRDAEIEELAERLRAATNAGSVEEAVRRALESQLMLHGPEPTPKTPEERRAAIDALRAWVNAPGGTGKTFDMKSFSDELWGEP